MGEQNLDKENKELKEKLAQAEEAKKQSEDKVSELSIKVDNLVNLFERKEASDKDGDDVVTGERNVPTELRIRAFNNMPIIKVKTTTDEKITDDGQVIRGISTSNIETIDGQKAKMPFGSTAMNDYLQLPVKKFKLVKQIDDGSEKSGCSRIERGQVLHDGGLVPEVKYMDNKPVATGKMVKQQVKKDVRYYTIEIEGKEYELSEFQIQS